MSGWFRWVIKNCREGGEALCDNDVEVYVLMYEGCGTMNMPDICIYMILRSGCTAMMEVQTIKE